MNISRRNPYGSGMFWLFQVLGWLIVSALLGYWNYSKSVGGVSINVANQSSIIFFILGIVLSFIYRQYMVKEGWLKLNLARLFPRIIVGSIIFGTLFTLIIASILDLLFSTIEPIIAFPYFALLGFIINFSLIFMLWSSIYLNYNYYKNYEKEEIKNLKLIAAKKEVELQNLKAQLNPHFIFNAMNSIRALIVEDPDTAKNAITKLSSILRNSLMASKRQFVSIEEEMEIVKKYLDLEKIRYEERLNCEFNIDPNVLSKKIPPLLISTLVENAIKHGIATNKNGGTVSIRIKETGNRIKIEVVNPGQYVPGLIKGTGIGLANTKKRLEILFGANSSFYINNETNQSVLTAVSFPKNIES